MLMSIKTSVFGNSSNNKGNPSKNVKDRNKSGKLNLDFNKKDHQKESNGHWRFNYKISHTQKIIIKKNPMLKWLNIHDQQQKI